MNSKLKWFAKIGLAVGKTIVPQIAVVEDVVNDLKTQGANKKQAVLNGVMLTPDILNLLEGADVVDRELFKAGVAEVNDGYVKIMNSFKKASQDDGPDL